MEQNERIKEEINSYYENWFRINHVYASWAQRHGTNVNMIFVLYVIATSEEGCTQQSLCKHLLLPKQTISFLLSKLEQQKYLYRAPNPKDRRNKLVFLTQSGQQYAGGILSSLEEAEMKAYKSVTAAQRRAITEGLHTLADALTKNFSGD